MQNLGHASLSRVNLKQTRGRYGHKPIEFILISMPSNQSQSKTLGPRPLVNMMISFSTWMTVGSPTIQFLGRQVSGLYSGIICYVQGAILRFEFIMLANTSIGRFKVFGRFLVRGSDQGLYMYPEYPVKVQSLHQDSRVHSILPRWLPCRGSTNLAPRWSDSKTNPVVDQSWSVLHSIACDIQLLTFNYSILLICY